MPDMFLAYASLGSAAMIGLVGGVFQAFSDFVMRGLLAARPDVGIEAMQAINRKVYDSVFLPMLMGGGPLLIGLALWALITAEGGAPLWLALAAAIYIASVLLVTMVRNVPMNQRLDGMAATSPEAAEYWHHYGTVWTRLNHIRTAGSVATALCLLAAAHVSA